MEVQVPPHLSLISAQLCVDQRHVLSALLPGKQPTVPLS
jgi:hypothetical protein